MILQLYQDKISKVIFREGFRDDNGDYNEGTEEETEKVCCDAVPAGAANSITFEDGTVGRYSYTVYFPRHARVHFRYGDTVRLYKNGHVMTFEVKGFHEYQLQKKMYI